MLRRVLLPRTLRGRLIAGLVSLLALACAAVGVVTYFAVQGVLSRTLSDQLNTATSLAYSCWQGKDGAPGGSTASAEYAKGGTSTTAAGGTKAKYMSDCPGLTEDTFVAVVTNGQWKCAIIGGSEFDLTNAEKRTLNGITAVPSPVPGESDGKPTPTTDRYLNWANGTYELTAVQEPGDTGIYITGLPLSSLHDELRNVALIEAAVFSVVLILAGVLGTFWVRFSLRPLRRVASTAAQVAELPLEAGEVSLPAGVPDTDPATETGQVGIAFNRMLGHVETALQRRAASEARLRRFAADASHELRTPLAAIRGYAELALLRPGHDPDTVNHALGRVLSESRRMSGLVDDLLLLARLDAGRPLSSGPVDMTRLTIDATSDAQAARPRHRWVLELPDDPVLTLGDEDRLRQVLANLLSNAGRHTPEGSTVTVRVSDELPAGDQHSEAESVSRGALPPAPRLVVSVTDDGGGIPADLLPELFERFTRADTSRSHAASESSTGLGLAIVDAVIAAHHGAVLVTSRPGLTRFTIVLAGLSEPDAPPEPPQTGRR